MAQDVAEFASAKAADEGDRVSLDMLRAELEQQRGRVAPRREVHQ